MKETNQDEALQSRREFFKKAAKKTLPMFGLAVFGPAFLSSCEKDEPDGGGSSSGCKGCSGSCSSSCSGSCDDSCSGNCDGCSGSCYTTGCKVM